VDLVSRRAHRILRRVARCRYLAGDPAAAPAWLPTASLGADERWLAVYENAPDSPVDAVAVTNVGLWLNEAGAWRRVRYGAIERSGPTPPVRTGQDKLRVTGLALDLADGSQATVPIRGGTDRTRDAWEFLRFVLRATADVRDASRS
jgi:hypothetical protein